MKAADKRMPEAKATRPSPARVVERISCGAASSYPPQLAEREQRLIAERRLAAGLPPLAERGRIGVAISGGGIRSATFALGLFQALARLKMP